MRNRLGSRSLPERARWGTRAAAGESLRGGALAGLDRLMPADGSPRRGGGRGKKKKRTNDPAYPQGLVASDLVDRNFRQPTQPLPSCGWPTHRPSECGEGSAYVPFRRPTSLTGDRRVGADQPPRHPRADGGVPSHDWALAVRATSVKSLGVLGWRRPCEVLLALESCGEPEGRHDAMPRRRRRGCIATPNEKRMRAPMAVEGTTDNHAREVTAALAPGGSAFWLRWRQKSREKAARGPSCLPKAGLPNDMTEHPNGPSPRFRRDRPLEGAHGKADGQDEKAFGPTPPHMERTRRDRPPPRCW